VVGVMLVLGCGGTVTSEAGPEQTSYGALTLRNAEPERISGRFSRDSVSVDFDTIRTAAVFTFEIRSADGKLLVNGGQRGEDYFTRLFDGRAEVVFSKLMAQTIEDGQAPPEVSDANLAINGDQAAMADLEKLPEYALLPWLSRALGEKGLNGRDYPAALALHQFGKSVSQRLDVQVPKLDEQVNASGATSYCTSYPNSWNDCYGMCGPGCGCWSWVCGDCCYHSGCARHDSWCRSHSFWGGIACWTAWVAAAFGC
jgi:hypothetical protein